MVAIRRTAALLLLCSLALPQSIDDKRAGDEAAAAGKFDEAGRHYEAFVRSQPSEENLFFLASFLLSHNGLEPARKVFEFGAGKYPESPRIRVGLGVAEYSVGQYDKAVQTLCEAVDLNPKDARALEFLGKMYDVSPVYAAEVTKRLEHFARVYPANATANYYYALCLVGHSASRAELYLRKALALDDSLTEAHYELGLILEKKGDVSASIRELQIAVRQAPAMAKAHYRLAQLYRRSGQEALASEEFQRLQKLKQN